MYPLSQRIASETSSSICSDFRGIGYSSYHEPWGSKNGTSISTVATEPDIVRKTGRSSTRRMSLREFPAIFRWPLRFQRPVKETSRPGKSSSQRLASYSVESALLDPAWEPTEACQWHDLFRERSLDDDTDSTPNSVSGSESSCVLSGGKDILRRNTTKSNTHPSSAQSGGPRGSQWFAISSCLFSRTDASVRKSRSKSASTVDGVVSSELLDKAVLKHQDVDIHEVTDTLEASRDSLQLSRQIVRHAVSNREGCADAEPGPIKTPDDTGNAAPHSEDFHKDPLSVNKTQSMLPQEDAEPSVEKLTVPATRRHTSHMNRRRLSLSQSAPAPPENIEPVRGSCQISKSLRHTTRATESSTVAPSAFHRTRRAECVAKNMEHHSKRYIHGRRLSVSGLPSTSRQHDFENKRHQIYSNTDHFEHTRLATCGIGYACKKGLKPESPNQDDFFILLMDDWALYGVFDGHGPYGHDVSNFVQKKLARLICESTDFKTNPKRALWSSFIMVHNLLEIETSRRNSFNCVLSGCTASVILHRKSENKLYIAHVGDSRCVLGRRHHKGIKAIDLTIDHKPNHEKERQRIVAAGGQVKKLDGDIPHRVFLKGRQYPGLAMSRAIGDTIAIQAGVTYEPDVTEYTLDAASDLFVVLCSDGVWEFLDSQEVVDIVHMNGPNAVQRSADLLAQESWARWIGEGNVVDDITVEIIYLQ